MADTNYYVDGDSGNDSNNGLTAGTAKLTIAAGAALATASGDIVNVKRRAANATYNLSSGVTFASGPSFTSITRIRGYGSTIGDGVKALVKATAGSITLFTSVSTGALLESFDLDGDNQSSVRGLTSTNLDQGAADCIFRNFTNSAVSGAGRLVRCMGTGCSTQPVFTGVGYVTSCVAVRNTVTAFNLAANRGSLYQCVIASNSGASTDGVATTYDSSVIACVIYDNGRHGLNVQFYPGSDGPFMYNIIGLNGGYGINCPSNSHGATSVPSYDYNAFYNNSSGNYNNITAGANDIPLTADPFVDAASDDFNINDISGGGALLRAVTYDLPG